MALLFAAFLYQSAIALKAKPEVPYIQKRIGQRYVKSMVIHSKVFHSKMAPCSILRPSYNDNIIARKFT
jgi:hypothetical protein